MGQFSAKVNAWGRKTRARQNAVHRRASELLFEASNLPVAKGGKMPVDLGFLRASFDASLSGMPVGPQRPDEGGTPDNSGNIAIVLTNASITDTIFAGWTAVYARRQEYEHYGFARSAAESWQEFVDQAVREAKASIR
jgi:hypothetical protein